MDKILLETSYALLTVGGAEHMQNFIKYDLGLDCDIVCDGDTKRISVY